MSENQKNISLVENTNTKQEVKKVGSDNIKKLRNALLGLSTGLLLTFGNGNFAEAKMRVDPQFMKDLKVHIHTFENFKSKDQFTQLNYLNKEIVKIEKLIESIDGNHFITVEGNLGKAFLKKLYDRKYEVFNMRHPESERLQKKLDNHEYKNDKEELKILKKLVKLLQNEQHSSSYNSSMNIRLDKLEEKIKSDELRLATRKTETRINKRNTAIESKRQPIMRKEIAAKSDIYNSFSDTIDEHNANYKTMNDTFEKAKAYQITNQELRGVASGFIEQSKVRLVNLERMEPTNSDDKIRKERNLEMLKTDIRNYQHTLDNIN